LLQPQFSCASTSEPVIVKSSAWAVKQGAAQNEPVEAGLLDRRFHRADSRNRSGCDAVVAHGMKRRFVSPRISAAGVSHGNALLKYSRHTRITAGAHEYRRAFTAKLIVSCVVALRGWAGKTGGEVDRDIATDEAGSKRLFVKYVDCREFSVARSCDYGGRRVSHQRADAITGSGQSWHQVTAIHAGCAENCDARIHVD
jgi:hypothetical protein